MIEAFDADVHGHAERDRRIEEERDRVLIAAVKLAATPSDDDRAENDRARRNCVDAIDYLEQAVLRFGIVTQATARRGYGDEGSPVSMER